MTIRLHEDLVDGYETHITRIERSLCYRYRLYTCDVSCRIFAVVMVPGLDNVSSADNIDGLALTPIS